MGGKWSRVKCGRLCRGRSCGEGCMFAVGDGGKKGEEKKRVSGCSGWWAEEERKRK